MKAHDETHPDCKILLKTLREVARAKKHTSASLAKKLAVSEVTVKRWFPGNSCSLGNIFQICEVLQISFFDLTALAKKEEEIDYFLSEEQDRFFAAKPALFGIFKQLHRREDPVQVGEFWGLNSTKLFSILRAFEKQGFLEVLPKNQVRMKTMGNVRYQHLEPLGKAILRPQITQFLDHIDRRLEDEDVSMHSAEVQISETHLKEFIEELNALGAKYRARAYRDQSLLPVEKLRYVRWLFALAPYQTNWRQYKV